MEIPLSQKLSFPVKTIVTSVDVRQIENYSHFSAVRLTKRHFERLGFFIAEGADFEDGMSFYFFDAERQFYDEYTKVKLGKSHMNEARRDYCATLLQFMPEPDARLLLVLCRFCAYTGAPGFPDLIAAKGGKWSLLYVLFDELSDSQKIFLLLSKLAGLHVEIVKPDAEEKLYDLAVDTFLLFNSVLGDRRAKNIMEGLEENVSEAETKAEVSTGIEKKIWEDEFNYLSGEKSKNSLFLFRKWKQQGFVSSSSLKGAVHFVMTHDRHDFEKFLDELRNDAEFESIKHIKTEDGMKSKAEYMQKKFGVGRTRSKLLLNFF